MALTLRAKRHMVVECEDDAGRIIAMKGIEVAREKKSATVVADDTDILVRMVHMWDQTIGDLFLRHEARKCIEKDLEIISIKNIASSLPSHVKENMLFIHAWGGCDTTSALFGQRKTAVLKFAESNGDFARH